MEVYAGDIIEIPHPVSTARIRAVVVEAEPLRARPIAYLASADGVWVHHIGAVGLLRPSPGAFVLSEGSITDSTRSIARTSDLLEEMAHTLRTFAAGISGAVGRSR